MLYEINCVSSDDNVKARALNLAERKARELARGLLGSDRRISMFMLDFLRRVYHLFWAAGPNRRVLAQRINVVQVRTPNSLEPFG